jgi:hypothetical protein
VIAITRAQGIGLTTGLGGAYAIGVVALLALVVMAGRIQLPR